MTVTDARVVELDAENEHVSIKALQARLTSVPRVAGEIGYQDGGP
jgi:hypothetical protein